MAIAMAGVVHANGNDDHARGCSDATLRGLYVFNAYGFNIVAGVAQPKAIVEFIRFNGDGTLTVPAATASINGVIIRSAPDGPGSYSACTGRSRSPPGADLRLVRGAQRLRGAHESDRRCRAWSASRNGRAAVALSQTSIRWRASVSRRSRRDLPTAQSAGFAAAVARSTIAPILQFDGCGDVLKDAASRRHPKKGAARLSLQWIDERSAA